MNPVVVEDLGTIAYDDAFRLQKQTVERLQNGPGDEVLYLLEHTHVITRGRNASDDSLLASPELLASRGVQLVETDRGGDITYHGPGQLVGYPILRLEEGRRDIRRYVMDLEEALVRTLAAFGIEGHRDPVHRGVWVKGRKIASVGIRISKWVTSHGFALNVDTDLAYFGLMHPCGITGCRMTTMSLELGRRVAIDEVKSTFIAEFGRIYEREMITGPCDEELRSHG